MLLRRLRNPLVLVLLCASALAAATGQLASFVMITGMVVLSIAIDFVQEHKAGKAAAALLGRVQLRARVLRDGAESSIPARDLVPGDVVLLAAGSVVPADGRLVEANGVHVHEAMLTGEPFPMEHAAGELLFAGTSLVSGVGMLQVDATGPRTRMAQVAARLGVEPPPTPFERGTHRFGLLVMRTAGGLVLFVLLASFALGRPTLESFLFALALAVGLTPELLPMIVTVTLARGATRLAAQHAIVKRLTAVEGLGSMDVLCCDKTGTLTEARIRLEHAVDAAGADAPSVRALGVLNSRFQRGIRNPLDEALLAMAPEDATAWRVIAEAPFDFERRRVGVILEGGGTRVLVVKGAPEGILGACGAGSEARETLAGLEGQGHRVLAVASCTLAADASDPRDESGLSLAGFLAFADPPKRNAHKAIAALAASGVAMKVVTGDGEIVTRHVCAAIGLPVAGVLCGEDIELLDGPALAARVDGTTIFCRVTPLQKERIVRALEARGHGVGFMGDGVNDAPALHAASVGISVDNAVDVAREAADIILLRRELEVVHRAVLEGRRTFANIRKYLLMGTSSNFGNMFSMAGAAAFLPFLPMLPTQVLLNNLLYDISEVPIPLDTVDGADLVAPLRWDIGLVRDFMWVMGPVSSLFDLLTFAVLLVGLHANEALFRTGWFVESLASQVLVIFVIRTRGSPFASRPSATLTATSLAIVALAASLPFMPFAGAIGFVPLPPTVLAILAALVIAYLAAAELAKRLFYARRLKYVEPIPIAMP